METPENFSELKANPFLIYGNIADNGTGNRRRISYGGKISGWGDSMGKAPGQTDRMGRQLRLICLGDSNVGGEPSPPTGIH